MATPWLLWRLGKQVQVFITIGTLTLAAETTHFPKHKNYLIWPMGGLLTLHHFSVKEEPRSSWKLELVYRTNIVCLGGFTSVGGFPDGSVGKESTCDAGDPSWIPESGRSAGEGTGYPLQYSWASLVAQLVKNPLAMQETWVRPWVGKIPWRRERLPAPVFWPGKFHGPHMYSPWGHRVRHDWATLTLSFCHFYKILLWMVKMKVEKQFFFTLNNVELVTLTNRGSE